MPNVSDLPRPNRLNAAGWCMCCGEWLCHSERCIHLHEGAHWGLCDECHGSQNRATTGICLACTDGLIEYSSHEDAVQSFTEWAGVAVHDEQRFVVVA